LSPIRRDHRNFGNGTPSAFVGFDEHDASLWRVRFAENDAAVGRGPFGGIMLYWAAVFFVIALLAAIFGFGGIAASAAGVAKILFFVFLILALLSFIFGRRVPT
jgi:uncharacterized membrane protein YtjA (UPF0391 family)